MSRRLTAVVALVCLVALSGCATITVSSDVESAETISTYEVQINTTTSAYGLMNEAAKEDGYDDLSENLVSQIGVPESKVDSSTNISGEDVSIHIEAADVSVANLSNVNTTVRDGRLHYRDHTFYGDNNVSEDQEQYLQGTVIQYQLTMPGEVNSSTADETEGNTATWRETGADAFTSMNVSASSPAPSSSTGIPGFGPAIAVIAVLGGVSAMRLQN